MLWTTTTRWGGFECRPATLFMYLFFYQNGILLKMLHGRRADLWSTKRSHTQEPHALLPSRSILLTIRRGAYDGRTLC